MAAVTLRGKEYPLLFTTYELKIIQEEIGPISRAINMVLGRDPDKKKQELDPEEEAQEIEKNLYFNSAEHIKAVAKMVRILANAWLEEHDQDPVLTDKKVMRGMNPAEMQIAIGACMDAMNEGMRSEIPDKKEEGPVDVTLEEIKKNEVREN